jgi:hypothetical protein
MIFSISEARFDAVVISASSLSRIETTRLLALFNIVVRAVDQLSFDGKIAFVTEFLREWL